MDGFQGLSISYYYGSFLLLKYFSISSFENYNGEKKKKEWDNIYKLG